MKVIYLINWCFVYISLTMSLVRASPVNNKMLAVAKMLKFLQNCEFNPNQPWTAGISYGCKDDVECSLSDPPSDSLGTRSTCLTFQLFKLTSTFFLLLLLLLPSSWYDGQCRLPGNIMSNVSTSKTQPITERWLISNRKWNKISIIINSAVIGHL